MNRSADVLLIQQLINANLPIPLAPLDENGVCDGRTIFAIEEYQRRNLSIDHPDGRVDVGGRTFRSLTGAPEPPAPKPHAKTGFMPPDVIQAAVDSHHKWNVPASVTLAQWALESGWGSAMPSGSNNPFGIKAVEGQPSVEATTKEVIKGKTITIRAKFRKFDSLTQAFDQHGALLATSSHYKKAMSHTDDPDAFADALTGIYATAPNYGTVLKRLMKTHSLYQYDDQ